MHRIRQHLRMRKQASILQKACWHLLQEAVPARIAVAHRYVTLPAEHMALRVTIIPAAQEVVLRPMRIRHVTDHNAYGCCAALAVAWGRPCANRSELATNYNTWFTQANLVSECNAYSNDLTCADALATTRDCAGRKRYGLL